MNYNPFRDSSFSEKEKVKDPLDVKELLTDGSKKAIITSDGELKLEDNDKQAAVELMKERYWGAKKHQGLFDKQLAIESRAMNSCFPQFKLQRCDKKLRVNKWNVAQNGEFIWLGKITTHSKRSYLVSCVYPHDYPFSEIRSYILQPYIPTTEHRFKEGNLCLYDHRGNGKGFESEKTTAVTIIAWTSAWLHAYEIWQKTGKWPMLRGGKKHG